MSPVFKIKNDASSFEAEHNEAIPDLCDRTGACIPFSCRAGACGTCRIRVLDSPQNLSPMDENEQDFLFHFVSPEAAKSERLACQCKVLGDVTVEVVDSGNHNHPENSPKTF